MHICFVEHAQASRPLGTQIVKRFTETVLLAPDKALEDAGDLMSLRIYAFAFHGKVEPDVLVDVEMNRLTGWTCGM
jgi:hypothetical protein